MIRLIDWLIVAVDASKGRYSLEQYYIPWTKQSQSRNAQRSACVLLRVQVCMCASGKRIADLVFGSDMNYLCVQVMSITIELVEI